MYNLNLDNKKHIHFIGIGGISMSGLAHVLIDRGFNISGSDRQHSALLDELESAGAKIYYSQVASNITDDTDLVVYTAAIHEDNEELKEVRGRSIEAITRADLLGNMMRLYGNSVAIAGTHGKTTSTSMISEILLAANAEPTLSIGGILTSINSNIHVGKSDIFVTEACEYTNSYHSFFAKYSVILNIEEDHLDFFKDINDIRDSFKKFASNTLSDGAIIIGGYIDDYKYICSDSDARIITFGLDENFTCYANNITYDALGHAHFDAYYQSEFLGQMDLTAPGEHNILNALSAICVAKLLNINVKHIKEGLKKFSGAKRRFEYLGKLGEATVIDDYAHHPSEVRAALSAARMIHKGRIVCMFQSHTYSRTAALLDEFADALSNADLIILSDIYAARETNTYGVSPQDIVDRLHVLGKESYYIPTFEEIEKFILNNFSNDDLLITMGAGPIDTVGRNLVNR